MSILLIGSEGYVGSYLFQKLSEDGNKVSGVDSSPQKTSTENFKQATYQELTFEFLSKFAVVLFFAGVSSVQKANENPKNAIEQNCNDMWRFACLCNKANVRLIYASSGSVYADSTGNLLFTASEMTHNAYDASKLAFDMIVRYAHPDTIGLRMGTVSGWSSSLRRELIFNAMCISAMENKQIALSNPHNYRSILFLSDLYMIIKRVLKEKKQTGQIPCSSYTGTIGQIAVAIATHFSVDIELLEGNSTYSFALKKSEFDLILPSSIDEECSNFKNKWALQNAK